jgi:VanZ family protein
MAKYKINSIIFTVLFAILIFIVSILPTDINGEPPSFYFLGMDKIIHTLMYGTLSFLVLNEYLKRKTFRFLTFSLLIIVTWAYSIIMELLQYYFIEYRSGDIKDAIANIIGIVLAALILLFYKKIRS